MSSGDIKRLGLILSVQAEIEGMRAANELVKAEYGKGVEYAEKYFQEKAEEIRNIVAMHEDQF